MGKCIPYKRSKTKMKTYRIKIKQVYIETVFAKAKSKDEAIQMVWSDDCTLEGSEYKSAEADIQSVEEVSQ